jgi:hypothetical protein
MKRNVAVIALFLSICVSANGVFAGLIEESVALDRAYIPALALTNQPDKPQPLVEEALHRLVAAWERFLGNLSAEDSAKSSIKEAINLSSSRIDEACRLVASNKRQDAHEALESVRSAFAKARGGLGINYLPDRFTGFHDPMEEFAGLAIERGTDAARLKDLLSKLSALWKAVEEVPLDAKLFKVAPERAAQYAGQVRKIRDILTQFERLIGSGNHEALVNATKALKGNFVQAYFVFADFNGLQ